ncbi:unnamed protein product [Closterium sp. Naga37s-1]|nr:unnamed protein product [Closterium sp. Naga37s-1]
MASHPDSLLNSLLPLPRLAHLSILASQTLVPTGAASVTLPSCLKSLSLFRFCPDFATMFPSASTFTGLEELLISNCRELESLPRGIGDLLPCLRKLTIHECRDFTHLPESVASLSRLEAVIVFSPSSRFTLPSDFGHLTALKLLVLEGLRFTELPPSFCRLTSLEALFLSRCYSLEHLPADFCRLTTIKTLVISKSCDLFLPWDVGALENLRVLRLDPLAGLMRLELTDCERLREPPAGLPPSLETLCLGPFRRAASHCVDISGLSQLRVLKLNCVAVVTYGPAGSSGLSCLQQLEQLEMRLGDDSRELPLPLTLICLPRLRCLLIQAPGICSLPENMAAALPQLQQLELLSWSPEELPGSILALHSLTSLTVEASQLVALPQGMSCLSRLRKLELIRCTALQHLPEFLTQLHQLILRDTSIPALPPIFLQLSPDSTGLAE